MGAKRLEELVAWQLARQFKLEVYAIVKGSPDASRDLDYRQQLFGAAASGEANIAEGFHRFTLAEFAHFLAISRGSLGEAKVRLMDGVDRGYFTGPTCASALAIGNRAIACVTSLKVSLEPFITRKGPRRSAP
jgi:four helix bundle protein